MMRTSAAAIAAGLVCVLGGQLTPVQARQARQAAPPATPAQRSAGAPARTGTVPILADASEIPALENDAIPPGPGSTIPACVRCEAPVWPSPIADRWRFRLHLVLEESGRVGTARIVQVLVGDAAARPVGPMGDVAPAVRDTPTARAGVAVLGAVRQWQFTTPPHAPLLLVIDVGVDEGVPLASASAADATSRAPLQVGGDVPPPRKLVDVPPVYPPDALAARVTGIVTIEAVIGTSGDVTQARVVKGVPLLDDAALAAVRQWRYTPTLLNGVPVPVVMTVSLNFSLR